VERDGKLARVTLDRPSLNILNLELLSQLQAELASLPAPPHLCFLVFRGAGEKAFSAGADVADHTPERVAQLLEVFHGVLRKLWTSDWISIAAVQGHCLGGGMELAMMCDFVLATHTAQFAQPEIKLGCFPPVAAVLLPALVGPRRALELILTGRAVSAEEAHRLGLVTQVVGENELESATQKWIEQLETQSSVVLGLTRRAVLGAAGLDFSRVLAEIEQLYLQELMKTEDAREGIRAFLERRRPVYVGR
jgi:cyclohexa-1,5-dienecarbonyl-CoA hydratase